MSPAILLGSALASGLVLFSSEPFMETLGLDAFRVANKPYIGGAFVVSIALLLSHSTFQLVSFAKGIVSARTAKKRAAAAEKARKQKLHELTPDEKAYLVPYVVEDANTQYFLIEDGVVGGLVQNGVLYQSSQIGSLVDGWAFNLQPWAKTYLKENPNLLEGFNPNPQGPPRW